MEFTSSDRDRINSEPTGRYFSDIAAFCELIYSSPSKGVGDPRATNLDTNSELYSSIREKWRRSKHFPVLPKHPPRKIPIGGLVFDLWRTTDKDSELDVWLLFFRGSDTDANDWYTNFRWVTRFIPCTWDQYNEVIAYTAQITTYILEKYPDATIVSAGHSLGGGLAQLAGYLTPDIKAVYAFNSSPVTGYFSVNREIRKRSRNGLVIFRIYEQGEVLAFVRKLMKKMWPISKKNPEIVSVRYNFTDDDPVSEHSMEALAKNIKREQDNNGDIFA